MFTEGHVSKVQQPLRRARREHVRWICQDFRVALDGLSGSALVGVDGVRANRQRASLARLVEHTVLLRAHPEIANRQELSNAVRERRRHDTRVRLHVTQDSLRQGDRLITPAGVEELIGELCLVPQLFPQFRSRGHREQSLNPGRVLESIAASRFLGDGLETFRHPFGTGRA